MSGSVERLREDVARLSERLNVMEQRRAADQATMVAHLRLCDERSQRTNTELLELKGQVSARFSDIYGMFRNVQWSIIGALVVTLAVVLGHDLLHIP